jgi:hypothetical protein
MALDAPLLSTDEIRHRLWAIQNSDRRERLAKRTSGVGTIARRTDCSTRYLCMIAIGERTPAPRLQAKLSVALQDVFPGTLD